VKIIAGVKVDKSARRYLWFGLFSLLLYTLVPEYYEPQAKTEIIKVRQEDYPMPTGEAIPAAEAARDITPTKKTEEPVSEELSHEEFLQMEKNYAQERLNTLVLGWCNASEIEVLNQFTQAGLKTHPRQRQAIINPSKICFNQTNKHKECFTYQGYCPKTFQETNEVTLLEFWSGEQVYRYERRVMDYRTYLENPDSPNFPPPNYWAARANEIKILAERIRGEAVVDQTWGIKIDAE
jgi:hypothetical protein